MLYGCALVMSSWEVSTIALDAARATDEELIGMHPTKGVSWAEVLRKRSDYCRREGEKAKSAVTREKHDGERAQLEVQRQRLKAAKAAKAKALVPPWAALRNDVHVEVAKGARALDKVAILMGSGPGTFGAELVAALGSQEDDGDDVALAPAAPAVPPVAVAVAPLPASDPSSASNAAAAAGAATTASDGVEPVVELPAAAPVSPVSEVDVAVMAPRRRRPFHQ